MTALLVLGTAVALAVCVWTLWVTVLNAGVTI